MVSSSVAGINGNIPAISAAASGAGNLNFTANTTKTAQ
jgi:hypothetical protein